MGVLPTSSYVRGKPGGGRLATYSHRVGDELLVRVDQDLCTGDGLCVQYAPEVFEFDVDGLAYVKGPDGELLLAAGGMVAVPPALVLDVIDSAKECPGACIYVLRASDSSVVAGPGAPEDSAS